MVQDNKYINSLHSTDTKVWTSIVQGLQLQPDITRAGSDLMTKQRVSTLTHFYILLHRSEVYVFEDYWTCKHFGHQQLMFLWLCRYYIERFRWYPGYFTY